MQARRRGSPSRRLFSYTIQNDGTLCAASTDVSADASCVIPPSLLPRLVLHDEAASAQIESCGDTALLTEIFISVVICTGMQQKT